MSYSFSVSASNKDEAGQKIEDQLTLVVASQPAHERDRQLAQDTAEAVIDVLVDPSENQTLNVSVSGWLSWVGDVSDNNFGGANVSVSASLQTKTDK